MNNDDKSGIKFNIHDYIHSDFFNNLKEGILIAKKQNNIEIIWHNHAALEMLGIIPYDVSFDKWCETIGIYYPDGKKLIKYEDFPIVRAFCESKLLPVNILVKNEFITEEKLLEVNTFAYSLSDNCTVVYAIIEDTTLFGKLTGSLLETESCLRISQRIGKMGNWEFDVQTEKFKWSDEVFNLYERSINNEPPIFEDYLAYFRPEEAEQIDEKITQAIKSGTSAEIVLSPSLPSGKTAFHVTAITPIMDYAGCVTKIIGIVQDITDSKCNEIEKDTLIKNLFEQNTQNEENTAVLLSNLKNDFITLKGFINKIKKSIANKQLDNIEEYFEHIDKAMNGFEKSLIEKTEDDIPEYK